MLRNYFKVAIRNLVRNRTYVFINVIGLSIAIAVCIVAWLNYRHAMDANKEHPHYEKTFKINGHREINGDRQGVGIVPLPLTTLVSEDISGVKHVTRFKRVGEVFKSGEDTYREDIGYVDQSFMKIFDFPLQEGSKEGLNQPGNIILSANLATKLFDEQSALGQSVRVISDGREYLYTVIAVTQPVKTNSSFRLFDALLTMDAYFTHNPEMSRSDWSQWVDGAFVQLEEEGQKPVVEAALQDYITLQAEANDHLPFVSFYMERIDDWAHSENELLHGRFWGQMAPSAMWGLNSSALLILLLSCFNFTNTSISFSNRRLKEIGVRKVFGGMRYQLIMQFVVENLLLILAALVLGLMLTEALVPAFNNLFWFLHIELDLLNNMKLIGFIGAMLLVVGAFSAIYPSVYISSFKPVQIFRGKTKFGSGNRFLRILIAGQFIITVYNIFGSIVFYQNGRYQTNLDQGYDMHHTIVVPIKGERDFFKLENALSQNTMIASTAGSNTQLAFKTAFTDITHEGAEMEVGWMKVGYRYFETMGIELKEGRVFDRTIDTPGSNNILINQQLAGDLGWYEEMEAIGKRLYLDSAYFTVIGVTRNFHEKIIMRGGDIRPVIVTLSDPADYQYLTVRSEHEDLHEVNDYVRQQWAGIFPLTPYDGYYQSRAIEVVEDTNNIIDSINIFVTCLSIILSSIGLYTLVSLNIIKRIKEIGIRKVLGASVFSIIHLLNRNFAGLLLIGAVVGSVSGYFVLDWLLSLIYAYRLPIDLWPMFFAMVVLTLVAMGTVGAKVHRAATLNPVDHLRNE